TKCRVRTISRKDSQALKQRAGSLQASSKAKAHSASASSGHPTCRHGYYVDPGFFLYQHESGRALLELAQTIFGSGRISRKSGSNTVLVYEVSSTAVLRDRVISFFVRYVVPFSCKSETFMRFKEILEMMQRREHLRDDGLAEIVRKVYSMNPASKGRARLRPLDEVLARILRGHTSD